MAETMLAAVYHGPDDLRIEERPLPEIRQDEALIREAFTTVEAGKSLKVVIQT